MFNIEPRKRSIMQVLHDRKGEGLAESLAGITILLVIIGIIGAAVTQDMGAVTVVATKSERQALVNSLVGDKYAVSTWGSPSAPHTEEMSLPNGHQATVTTWLEDESQSTRFTAVTAGSSSDDAPDCTTASSIAKAGCVYASRVHAADLDSIQPHAIIRADPSGGTTVGMVNPYVTTNTVLSQDTQIAAGADGTATVWRYLIDAQSTGSNGEIRIVDTTTNKNLAIIPIDNTMQNYFGTFSVPLNDYVVVNLTSGSAIVKTVFLYRARSTS